MSAAPRVVTAARSPAIVRAVTPARVQVVLPARQPVSIGAHGPPGPQGPPGVAGEALRIDQAAPAATWVLPHGLGRVPAVDVYLPSGEQVDTDVVAGAAFVTVTFPAATSGFVVLT